MSKFKEYIDPSSEEHFIDTFTNPYFIKYFNDINEVFNRSADVTITGSDSNSFSTSFEINDIQYIFIAKIEDKKAIIIFYPLDDEIDIFKERKNNKSYLVVLFNQFS